MAKYLLGEIVMNYWRTYRHLICAYLLSLVLMPFALGNFTPRAPGMVASLAPVFYCFFGLGLIRVVIGVALKEQSRFVTFYTVLFYTSLLWMPAVVNFKLWLTRP